MSKKLALVIGLGEVGKPILEMLQDAYDESKVYGRDIETPCWGKYGFKDEFEFMHICIPQTPKFLKIIADYVEQYDPQYVIIHSTLHPGTMRRIARRFNVVIDENQPHFYYSPVRANVRDGMKWGLTTYTKYVSGAFNYSSDDVVDHLAGSGMPTKPVYSVASLEYAKLFNLAYYGTCIAIFQAFERIVEDQELDYDEIKEFIFSTQNEAQAGGKNVPRPYYYGGHIDGHCVIPALEKIVAAYDVDLFRAVIASNVKRERELTLK
jgi:UDP-N-acetyl-D-mannosaminuronate dehydrogenase